MKQYKIKNENKDMQRISTSISCSKAGPFVQAVNGTRLGKLILKPLHDAVSAAAKDLVRKSQLADRVLALEVDAQKCDSREAMTDDDILEQAGNFKAIGDTITRDEHTPDEMRKRIRDAAHSWLIKACAFTVNKAFEFTQLTEEQLIIVVNGTSLATELRKLESAVDL